jgi:hypothetical protein
MLTVDKGETLYEVARSDDRQKQQKYGDIEVEQSSIEFPSEAKIIEIEKSMSGKEQEELKQAESEFLQ